MDSLLDDLEERRDIFEDALLTDIAYLLQRVEEDDGGGTNIQYFRYYGINFKCRLQFVQRRPEETQIGNASITVGDYVVVYRPDGILDLDDNVVRLNHVDRLQVGTSVYSIRDIYDNIVDQMTSRAYLGNMPDEEVTDTPPLEYEP